MEPLTNKKIRVKFSSQYPEIPYLRQTPGSRGVWGNCQFSTDETVSEFDWWFVWNSVAKPTRAYGPMNRTVLITGEGSPDIKQYPQWFIDQFGYVISTHPGIKHHRITRRQIGPWMVGHFGTGSGVDPKDFPKYFTTYDDYAAMKPPKKTGVLSVVNSTKDRTPGQRKRLALIKALKEHFGERMDVFGAGFKRINDKMDGIAPYQYYLMIENDSVPSYITGIWDVYLGFAFPFFYGGPDLERYYDRDAFIRIDADNPAKSIAIIEKAIAEGVHEKRSAAIAEARERSLNQNNMFALMAAFVASHEHEPKDPVGWVTLKPEKKPALNSIVRNVRKFPHLYSLSRWMYRKYRTLRHL